MKICRKCVRQYSGTYCLNSRCQPSHTQTQYNSPPEEGSYYTLEDGMGLAETLSELVSQDSPPSQNGGFDSFGGGDSGGGGASSDW